MSGISLKKPLIVALFSLLLVFAPSSHAMKENVQIGVLTIWREEVTKQMWQPTMDYLGKKIPGHSFTLKPLRLGQTTEYVKLNSIDFILTNPGNYIDLEARFGISRLTTLKTLKQKKFTSQFGAVIFTRHNRDDIQSLDDLRDKSFMAVKKNAFGGFQMAWLELKNQDMDPFKDFSELKFSGFPQDNVVHAVLKGTVDAGTVRTSTLERMAKEGKIDITQIKVLNSKTDNNFPLVHSTQLYPEWPFAKLKNTSAKLANKVKETLLQVPANSAAAKKSNSAGWTIPLDYFLVRNLFKKLNLAPYKTTLPGFFERYWGQSLLFLIIFLQPIFLYILKLRINIKADEEKLALAETEWSNALDFLDEPMYMVDLQDRIIRANKSFYKKIQATAEEAIGQKVTKFTHPEGEEIPCKVCQARKDLVDTVITLEADDPVNIPGVPTEISVKVIRNNNGKAIGIIQKMLDLTTYLEAEKALRRNELLFKELLNATPDSLIVSNMDGTIILVNTQFVNEFGYKREEIVGQKIEKLIPKEQRLKHVNIRTEYSLYPYSRPMGEVIDLVGQHKDGHLIPIGISLSPFTIDDEMLTISTIHNITERIKKEKELKHLASIPEFNPNPILEFKKDKKITYANSASQKTFPDLMAKGSEHELLINVDTEHGSFEKHPELIRNIEVDDLTFEQKIVYNSETKLFRMYIWDVTKLRNLTQKMTHQATHDVLTNLINRREFQRQLEQIVEETKHSNKTHSLCYMDLDKFKTVNDSCGHAAGDELLKQLSSVINLKVRESDTFARLGGDEFGLLLIGCPIKKAVLLAEEIRITVEKFRFLWDGKTFKLGISIGIVSINKESSSAKEMQSAADTACYIAKEQGRNLIQVYEPDSTAVNRYTNQSNWLNRINTALDDDTFVLYFQKIVSLRNSEHEYYEVLIRMLDDNGKTIPPNSFIPAAERFFVMSAIDSWVIKHTLLVMKKEQYSDINFSVNLSGQSLSNLNFMNDCISQVADSDIHTTRLSFEITETAMIENLTNARRSVSTLRGLGCKIALDDFGSGLSSFSYLKNLPVDYLKIDGSLIKGMENDPINVTMVKSIIQIGRTMGLEIIAEYVESDIILKILRDLEIDFVQGYGIAEPVPVEKLKPKIIKPSVTKLKKLNN